MPKASLVEKAAYPLPLGVVFPAVLQLVTVRKIEFFKKDQYGAKTDEKDSFDKWIWEFKVTDGEHEGIKVYGETEDELTTLEDNRVRQWAETLLGTELTLGQDLDTDVLIGLPCQITVRHDEPRQKKDGGTFYACPVDDVYPVSSAAVDW